MANISFGAAEVFNSGETNDIAVAALSETKIVVAYRDEANHAYGTCIVGTINGDDITWGSAYVFNPNITYNIAITAIDSSVFVVAYSDYHNSNMGTAIAASVSGTSITYGKPFVFNPASTSLIAIDMLSYEEGHNAFVVIAYRDIDNSHQGTAVIGRVYLEELAVEFGPEYIFNNAATDGIGVSRLEDTKFVVSYSDAGNGAKGTCIIGTVSELNISYGNEYIFNYEITRATDVDDFCSSAFVVSYVDASHDDSGTCIIGMVTGSVINYAHSYVFSHPVADTQVIVMDDETIIVNYIKLKDGFYAIDGDVTSGTDISFNDEVKYAAELDSTDIAKLSLTKFVVSYNDKDNEAYGTAKIGTLYSAPTTFLKPEKRW